MPTQKLAFFTDHQRLGAFLVQDIRIFHRFHFLYYSYIEKYPFCTEEFKMLGFSQEHHADPLDSTFLHQASSNDAKLMKILMLLSSASWNYDMTMLWPFKDKEPTGVPIKVLLCGFGNTIKTVKIDLFHFKTLYSVTEFDADSDFAIKRTLQLWYDTAVDIQRQNTMVQGVE